ncbi:hypothetical protein C6P41_001607 [Kluyveromyces marxianus]|nr:hypothetical protein C6P43_003024 [Kluyveromyces marxianus]KAG0684868.1 hypothetical protein C6P41_001607 [Kluyveromyces marxianus]
MSTPEQAVRSLLRSIYLSNEPVPLESIMALQELLGSDLQFDQNGKDKGMSEYYIDSLPREPKNKLKTEDTCAICQCNFLEDPYPLVAKLPHCNHAFDLECLSVWLQSNHTCPMCRDDLTSKHLDIDTSQCELEEDFNMYG